MLIARIMMVFCVLIAFTELTRASMMTDQSRQPIAAPNRLAERSSAIIGPMNVKGSRDYVNAAGDVNADCVRDCIHSGDQENWLGKAWADPVAAFTGLLFFSTVLLWVSTERTLRHARESSERQLRAYVFVAAQAISASPRRDIMLPIQSNSNALAHMVFKNTGQTPAYDVRIYGEIDLVPWPIEQSTLTAINFNNSNISSSTLGSGQDTHKISLFSRLGSIQPANLSDVEYQGLLSGSLALVAHGEVRYLDAFGKQRWTRYRTFVGGFYSIQGPGMGTHAEGNAAN